MSDHAVRRGVRIPVPVESRAVSDHESVPAKPLLRGWFHPFAALASLIVTIILLVRTAGDHPRFFSLLVFGVAMILLFTISSIYHIGNWSPRVRQFWRTFDHSNIYLVIAGTYTPISVIVLDGWMRVLVLALIWSAAVAGVATSWLTFRLPRWVSAVLYIAMGWFVVIPLPSLLDRLPASAMLTLLLGGIFYTVGGVIYATKRPNPFPRVFGFHEIFHLFVVAGAASFIVMVWVWVVPFTK